MPGASGSAAAAGRGTMAALATRTRPVNNSRMTSLFRIVVFVSATGRPDRRPPLFRETSIPLADLLLDRPLLGRQHLARSDLDGQLLQLARKGEQTLIVFVDHRGAGVAPHIERLVP